MRRNAVADQLRFQAIIAMMDKDAGVIQFLKDLFKAVHDISSGSEEETRIQEYIKKNPTIITKLEEMAELIPTAKPLIRKMMSFMKQEKYSGLKDLGRKIKRFFQRKNLESEPKPSVTPETPTPSPEKPLEKTPEELPKEKPSEKKSPETTTPEPLEDTGTADIKKIWTEKGVNITGFSQKGSQIYFNGFLRRPLQIIVGRKNANRGVLNLRLRPKGLIEVTLSSTTSKKKKTLAEALRGVLSRFERTRENIERTLQERTPSGELRFKDIIEFYDWKNDQKIEQLLKRNQNPEQVTDTILDSMIKNNIRSLGIQAERIEREQDTDVFRILGTISDDIEIIKNSKPASPNIIYLQAIDGGKVDARISFPDLIQQTEKKVEEKIQQIAPEKAKKPRTKPEIKPVSEKPAPTVTPKTTKPTQESMSEIIRKNRQKGISFDT